MANLLNIAFITDLHIGQKEEKPRGVDVRENLKQVILALKKQHFDFLVIGGDLCFKQPKKEIYKWIKKQLDRLKKPYYIIQGNHDDNSMISSVYNVPLNQGQLYELKIIRSIPFVFLDSGPGELGPDQWNWFEGILNSISQENIVLFIHHPPLSAGVPYMDKKHNFKESAEFEALLDQFPNKKFHIFCGHYHVEKFISYKNAQIHICPSLFFQIDQHKEDFNIDHKRPGYAMIGIQHDGLTSAVHYV